MLMFYFITQFFRRSPTNNTANNATLPTNLNKGYAPGNLFAKGDLLVIIYIFEKFLLKI
jgi:hypothetical protein